MYRRSSILLEFQVVSRRARYISCVAWESHIFMCGHPRGRSCSAWFVPSISPWLLSAISVPYLFGRVLTLIRSGRTGLSCQVLGCVIDSPGLMSSCMMAVAELTRRPFGPCSSLPPSLAMMIGELLVVAICRILWSISLCGLRRCVWMNCCTCVRSA